MSFIRTLALLLLRCAVGVVFLYHGLVKVGHLHQTPAMFSHMGFPAYFGYIAAFLETIGGAALVLGLAARVFGILFAGEMLIAFLRVHLPSGPITHVPGYELPMLLSAASFMVFAYGAGAWSADGLGWFGGRQAAWARRP